MSENVSENKKKSGADEELRTVKNPFDVGAADDDQPEQITFDDQPYDAATDGDEDDDGGYAAAVRDYENGDDGEYPDLDGDGGDGFESEGNRDGADDLYEGDDKYIENGGVRLGDDEINLVTEPRSEGRKSLSALARESVLIRFFGAIFIWIFQKIRYSFVSFVLSTNTWIKKGFDKAFAKRFLSSSAISAKIYKLKRTAARLLSESYIISDRAEIGSRLLRTPVRRIGAFLLATGSGTVALYMANLFAFKVFDIPPSQLYVGILLCIPSVVMLAFGGTVLEFVRSSHLMRTMVFGFFNADIKLKDERPIEGNISAVLLAGLALACLSLLVPLHQLIIIIALIICAVVVLKSPEVGIVALILVLPFFDFTLVMLLTVAIWVSYSLKYFCGKRVINYEYVDLFPLLLMILFLLGGVVTAGGMSIRSLVPAALVSIYFLVAGIIRDSVWAKRCRAAFAIDAVVMSVLAILRIIPGNPLGVDMIFRGQSDVGGSTYSAFKSSGVLAIMLGMLLLIQVAGVFSERSKGVRFGFALISIMALVAAAISTYHITFLLILAATFVLLLFISKGFIAVPVGAVVFMFIMPLLGLPSLGDIVTQTEAVLYYRNFLWQDCYNMIPDIYLSGIGSSPDAFQLFYDGVWEVSDPKSLILSLLFSYGVCGILFFVVMIFFFVQYCFSHGRSCSDKRSPSRLYTYAGLCAVIAVLLIGVTENVFFNYRVAAMFWIVMGFTVSVQRYSARESSHDYLDDPNIVPEI